MTYIAETNELMPFSPNKKYVMKASIYTTITSTFIFICLLSSLQATRYYFVSPGNWNTSSNWSQGNYPGTDLTASDTVYLNANCTVPQNLEVSNAGFIRSTLDFKIEGMLINNNVLLGTLSSYIFMENSGTLNNYGNIQSSGLFSVWYNGYCTNFGSLRFIDCYITNLHTFINKGSVDLDIYSDVDNSASFTNEVNGILNIAGYFGNEFTGDFTNQGTITLENGGLNNYSLFYNYGTINGNGTIGGTDTILNYAELSPGNSPGILTFSTAIQNSADAVTTLEIEDAIVGQYDQINGSGAKILGGTLNLVFLNDFIPTEGDDLMLIQGNISGGFDDVNLPPLPPNLNLTFVIDANGLSLLVDQVLDVELNSFSCHEKSNHILLQWSTLSEQNNKGFRIEKSVDGRSWEFLHFEKGIGESIDFTQYKYKDESALPGLNYYRIIQEDFDGRETYSKTISIRYSERLKVEVFPNPVSEFLQIKNKKADEIIQVYNSNGTRIFTGNNNELNVSNFQQGLYYIKLNDQIIPFSKI